MLRLKTGPSPVPWRWRFLIFLAFAGVLILLSVQFFQVEATANGPKCEFYLVMTPCGGLNNNRWSMPAALVYAAHVNATLVVPRVPTRRSMCRTGTVCERSLDPLRWWLNTVPFEDLFDLEHFTTVAEILKVRVVHELPACLRPGNEPEEITKHIIFPNGSKGDLRVDEIQFKYGAYPRPQNCLRTSRDRHKQPGWRERCNAGVMHLDCTFGFGHPRPSTDAEWTLWRDAVGAFKFNRQVLGNTSIFMRHMRGRYYSVHLRIEPDAPFDIVTGYNSREEFLQHVAAEFAAARLDVEVPIFVAVGLKRSDPSVQSFIHHPLLKNYTFVMADDVEDAFSVLSTMDVEFQAAVQYSICKGADIHFGLLTSSFDFMLTLERNQLDNVVGGQSASELTARNVNLMRCKNCVNPFFMNLLRSSWPFFAI